MLINYWLLPQVPGFSKFMFALCALILIMGLAAYIFERRKELKKAKSQVS